MAKKKAEEAAVESESGQKYSDEELARILAAHEKRVEYQKSRQGRPMTEEEKEKRRAYNKRRQEQLKQDPEMYERVKASRQAYNKKRQEKQKQYKAFAESRAEEFEAFVAGAA